MINIKPMLAFPFSVKRATFPNYAQPKLNGIRGCWAEGKMRSRGLPNEFGKVWKDTIPHVVADLLELEHACGTELLLDGEMYCHGLSLQQINSRCAVNRHTKHKEYGKIKYYIFDTLSKKDFHNRNKILEVLQAKIKLLGLTNIVIVETHLVGSYDEFEYYHKLNLSRGFEGTMWRDGDAPYGFLEACTNKENRWGCLLKRKNTLDMDCTIVGVIEGRAGVTGEFLGKAGALLVESDTGKQFKVGTGIIIAHRKLLWEQRESFIGVTCKILYDELSDAGLPLRARMECINDPRL